MTAAVATAVKTATSRRLDNGDEPGSIGPGA